MSVRIARRGSIAASRASAPAGGTFTIYGRTTDGFVFAAPANVDGAGSGSNDGATTIYVGQEFGTAYESFIEFDTSTVVGTVTSVTLSLWVSDESSVTDFTLEARLHDWGTFVSSGDWLSRGTLSSKTLMASKSTAGISAGGYIDFTSEAAFASNINQAGYTRLVLCSSRHRNSQLPSGLESVGFASADTSGTSNDPKLVVVTS